MFTPLLAEGRSAQLDLGVAGSHSCRITGFAGPQVFLDVDDAMFAHGERQSGYLLLNDGDDLHAVRGEAEHAGPGRAVMRLTDTFRGQRRLFSRAPVVRPVHVRGLGDGGAEWDTFTRDISAGGLSLARQSAWDGAERCALRIRLSAEVHVEVEAEVRRVSADTLGMRFLSIAPEHRALLAELAVAHYSR
jgi:hypothetical protein